MLHELSNLRKRQLGHDSQAKTIAQLHCKMKWFLFQCHILYLKYYLIEIKLDKTI